jgi:hypothetical protein
VLKDKSVKQTVVINDLERVDVVAVKVIANRRRKVEIVHAHVGKAQVLEPLAL